MNKRILMVVLTAAVVTTTSGCTPFRNFFFGRGAKCGLCNRLQAPFQRHAPVAAAPQPTCNQPTYVQPGYAAPAADCGCNPGSYMAPQASNTCGSGCGSVTSGYGPDPYAGVVGNGVTIDNGQSYYNGTWVPAPTDSQGYRSNYMGYPDTGYKVDRDGNRIIYEDPLPPNAQAVN